MLKKGFSFTLTAVSRVLKLGQTNLNKMAQTQTKSFTVEPVFSLKGVKKYFSSDIIQLYQEELHKVLNRHGKKLPPLEVGIEQLPMKLRSMPYIYTPIKPKGELTLEQAYEECLRLHIKPVSLPYLLGMVQQYSQVLLQELESAQSIETVYWPDTFSFHSRFGKKKLQLCIKKQNNQLVFKISDFVSEDNVINPFRRIGPTGVRIVVERIDDTKEKHQHEEASDLEGKIIG